MDLKTFFQKSSFWNTANIHFFRKNCFLVPVLLPSAESKFYSKGSVLSLFKGFSFGPRGSNQKDAAARKALKEIRPPTSRSGKKRLIGKVGVLGSRSKLFEIFFTCPGHFPRKMKKPLLLFNPQALFRMSSKNCYWMLFAVLQFCSLD